MLVTDGQVGNEDQLLAAMGGELGRLRVFTLGIDQAVNAAFLRRLAGLGGGACELVESEDRLDEVMGKIHRRIATPILTDLAIDGRFLDAASQAPRRLPSVFAGAPVTVYLRCAERPAPGQTVTVHGRLPAGTATALTVVLDSVAPGVDLEAAWGRARIRDLEDRYAAGESTSALEREIVATSPGMTLPTRSVNTPARSSSAIAALHAAAAPLIAELARRHLVTPPESSP